MKVILTRLLVVLSIPSCVSVRPTKHKGSEVLEKLEHDFGAWKNEYKRDSQLAGVVINKFMEGIQYPCRYLGGHPASIWYVFWNGDVRANLYEPDGSVQSSQLWKGYFERGPDFWNDVDFTAGSDPEFKRHGDPRKPGPADSASVPVKRE